MVFTVSEDGQKETYCGVGGQSFCIHSRRSSPAQTDTSLSWQPELLPVDRRECLARLGPILDDIARTVWVSSLPIAGPVWVDAHNARIQNPAPWAVSELMGRA
jgi:hypothetical protein